MSRHFGLIAALVMAVLCAGCLFWGKRERTNEEARQAKEREQAASAFQTSVGRRGARVSFDELDQLTYGYADRFYMVMSSAVDAIKRNNSDAVQRRMAHQIKLNGVLAMNDIVSGGDPYSRTLDLVVAVTLESILLIDENGAQRMFGDRAAGLIKAIRTMRVEAWELAARVLTQDQLELLDYIILEWRRTHRDIEQVAFVKFDDFASVRATALLSDFKAGGGFLAPVNEAGQVMKDWARLTERAFWYSKRAPSLAGIEAEGAVNEILAAPEIGALIQTADHLGKTVDSVPQTIDAQRKAFFTELDARQQLLTNSLADLRRILGEANNVGQTACLLNTNVQQTLLVLGDTLKVAGGLGQQFGLDKPSTTPPGRPFDIQDYAAALIRLNEVITNAQQLSLNADQMVRSPGWNSAMQNVQDVVDRRLDRALRNTCLALGFAFVLAILYRFISLALARRMASATRSKP